MIDARELVPPSSYEFCKKRGLDPLILIDDRLLSVYKKLKLKFPKIYVNNWHLGGKFSQSGYRNDGSGASISQHRFGRALDIHGVDNGVLYSHILKWRLLSFRAITTIENPRHTVGWLHIDVRYTTTGFQLVSGG